MKIRKKIAIIHSNILPLPSVSGGAIETLLTMLMKENENQQKVEFIAFSKKNKQAMNAASHFKFSKIYFIEENHWWEEFYSICLKALRKIGFKHLITEGYYRKIFKLCKKLDLNAIVAEGGRYIEFDKFSSFFGKDKMFLHIHHHLECSNKIQSIFGHIIAISDFVDQEWRKTYNGTLQKHYIVQNGIDLDLFNQQLTKDTRDKIRQQLSFTEEDFVVLFCGRMIEVKGVRELIYAITKLNHPNIKLLIIGSPQFALNETNEYTKEIGELVASSRDRIRQIGYVPNSDLYKYYKAANLLVVPSLWEEAAGLVAIEGMACGLPLIITKSGGMVEYVDKKCGLIIEKDKYLVDSLAKAIYQMYINKEQRKEFSENSLLYGKRFSQERFYHEFIKIFI